MFFIFWLRFEINKIDTDIFSLILNEMNGLTIHEMNGLTTHGVSAAYTSTFKLSLSNKYSFIVDLMHHNS